MAQKRELIHELVGRSRERVVQVRAGNSLHRVLQQGVLSQTQMTRSLPNLPPPIAILPKFSSKKDDRTDVRNARRRRDALPVVGAGSLLHLPEEASSFDQYQHFMDSKLYRVETLRQRQRRAALAPKADLLEKLAAVCAAAMAEMEAETNSDAVRESLREKLLRAMALLRTGRAFENAKKSAPPPAPAYAKIKNAHLAFLEFRRDGANQKHVHPSAGMQNGNTSTKTPIHFGDQICLLSVVSDTLFGIGTDGRSHAVNDNSAGPHMTFTVVDFRNPSRYDEVTASDDFWLRVDPAFLAPRKRFDPRRLYFHQDLDQTNEGDDGEDLPSLLSDTNYYLGCPGWLDDEDDDDQKEVTALENAHARTQHSSLRWGRQRFRLVAMKACTPAREFYGDDAATREYSVETNEAIMRLARWRFFRYTPRRHEEQIEQDVNDALVNCSVVYLVLSDFALVYDEELKRGVGVRVSSESSENEVLTLHADGKKARSRCPTSSGGKVVTNVAHLTDSARWQVRLLHRSGGESYLHELELAMAAVIGDVQKEDGARVEWLRKKKDKLAANERRLHVNSEMVTKARRQYDLVAAESNSKLEQIERQKDAQAPGYFQRRLQVLKDLENNHRSYEITQRMHQQLHRVVELPRL